MARRTLSLVAVESAGHRPTVALCTGKDCRKRGEFTKMRTALEKSCDVVDLSCIGLCDGPVVVIGADSGAPKVFSKLRSKRHRTMVVSAVLGDRRALRDLSDRRVTKAKALGRVKRQAARRLLISRNTAA